MIEIKSSMSADKIKGPIVKFTLKKNSHAPPGLELLDLSWEQATGIPKNPMPSFRGRAGGTKPTCRIPFFLLGNPGIVIQPLKWNCKVTFLNKPWALVRKYLRLAPEELSASMMTAAQFLEGCHPYTCAASV